MCGRFTLRASAKDFVEVFGCPPAEDHSHSLFNIAPSQLVTAIRTSAGSRARAAARLRWGLIPSWADDPAIGNRMINARAETVATKPAFRHAFRRRRCLIAADGFYEWRRDGRRKQPFYISLADGRPFAFAGLWDQWKQGGEPIESCTIITTEANDLVHPIHDRMPVILSRESYDTWLDPTIEDVERLASLLKPYPAQEMQAYPVSTLVNAPANDLPECIARIAESSPADEKAAASKVSSRKMPQDRQLWLE